MGSVEDSLGEPMIHTIVDVCEHSTSHTNVNNAISHHVQLIQTHLETVKLASVDCSICMDAVHEESVITDCDHYFHGPCLAAYAQAHRSTPVQVLISS